MRLETSDFIAGEWFRPEHAAELRWHDGLSDELDPVSLPEPWLVAPLGIPLERYPLASSRADSAFRDWVRLISTQPPAARDAIRDFVGRHGFLHPGSDHGWPRVDLWGEPLSCWRREIATFRVVWAVSSALDDLKSSAASQRRAASRRLQDRVTWRDGQPHVVMNVADVTIDQAPVVAPAGPVSLEPILDLSLAAHARLLDDWRDRDIEKPARFWRERAINARLLGQTSLQVQERDPRVRAVPHSLCVALWVAFAVRMAERQLGVRVCRNPQCPNGRLFFPERKDQLSCSARCRTAYATRQARKEI